LAEKLFDKDLRLIAENISIFIGKDKESKRILKQMGLTPEDISDELRDEVRKVGEILTDTEKDPVERIDAAWGIVERLSNERDVPANIRKLILGTALERLDTTRRNIRWEKGEESTMRDIGKISYSLDLFTKDDKKTKLMLKRLGITQVPKIVRQAALDAQAVMKDKKLTAKERALRAADILTAPLTPALTGKRLGDIKDVHKGQLQTEIKCVIWEIANDFTYRAAKEG
jgi:uncharacterized protein (UPF0147 family)